MESKPDIINLLFTEYRPLQSHCVSYLTLLSVKLAETSQSKMPNEKVQKYMMKLGDRKQQEWRV